MRQSFRERSSKHALGWMRRRQGTARLDAVKAHYGLARCAALWFWFVAYPSDSSAALSALRRLGIIKRHSQLIRTVLTKPATREISINVFNEICTILCQVIHHHIAAQGTEHSAQSIHDSGRRLVSICSVRHLRQPMQYTVHSAVQGVTTHHA